MLSIPVLVGACMGCGLLMAQTVTVTPGTEYQVIRGFGGMNGAGWISDLTTAQVNAAFGSGEGQIGLSIMRLRIDPSSSNWSVQVPSAARASALGAKILATPWSAPASMKSNNSLIKGGTLLAASYSAYATHLLDFTTYMSRNSAPIYALSLQNEPDWAPDYESGTWTSSDFINFLTSQGSRLSGQKVVVTESLNSSQALANPILNNAIASNYVSIIGGHLYGVQPKDYPLARSKGKELWMSGGTTREFWVSIPSGYDKLKAYPLIVGLHWSGGAATDVYNGNSWASGTPFYGLKDLYGETAIFVAPNGLDSGWANTNDRDINFIQAMVTQLEQGLCINSARVFATGFSYGGMMSNAIGCEMGGTFRAIASMSGSLWSGCSTSSKKVAAMLLHSEADAVVAYQYGVAARDEFVSRNQCGSTTVAEGSNGCVEYQGCATGYPVVWCGYKDGGHWPSSFAGKEIKTFFDRF